MTGIRLIPAILSATIAFLIVTGGCTLLKPAENESHYYLLTAQGSDQARSDQKGIGTGDVVRLLPVEVANYLRNQGIAVRDGTSEIDFDLFHQWAEPLSDGIRRVLAEDLQMMPGIRSVLTDQSGSAGQPVYTISIDVLTCEGLRTKSQGSAIFKAEWAVTRSGSTQTTIAHGIFQPPPQVWHSGDYTGLANELSHTLNEFARVLACAISGTNPARTSSAP